MKNIQELMKKNKLPTFDNFINNLSEIILKLNLSMKNNTLVFTATFNESENIKNFLNIALDVKNIDILIIDDNSPDGTAKIIENL